MVRSRRPSKQMIALIEALSAQPAQWRHGYDLMKAIGLSSGTLYPLLMRLTEQGLVEAQWSEPAQPGRPPRHSYRLTAAGRSLVSDLVASRGAVPAKASLS